LNNGEIDKISVNGNGKTAKETTEGQL